jgi:hypothetical protein
MSETSQRWTVREIRRNPWVMGLALTPMLICVGAIVGAIMVSPAFLVGMIHGLGLTAASLYYAWHRNPWPRRVTTNLRIEGDQLVIAGERIERDDIAAGFVTRDDQGRPRLRIERKGPSPNQELELDDEADGRRILAALGLDAAQTITSFRGMALTQATILRSFGLMALAMALGVAVGSLAGMLGNPAAASIAGAITMGTLAAFGSLMPTRIEVGTDGVLIRWLTYRRFIPHAEITGGWVQETGLGRGRRVQVMLQLEGGEKVRLPITSQRYRRERADLLVQRIAEARQVGSHTEGADTRVLERRGREVDEWVRALRELTRLATHRAKAVAPGDLWQVVESPSQDPLARAAAAIALEPELDASNRQRLRVAAQATASPKLRIALDAVADQAEDEALTEALSALDEDRETR